MVSVPIDVSSLSGVATPGAMGVVILYCWATAGVDSPHQDEGGRPAHAKEGRGRHAVLRDLSEIMFPIGNIGGPWTRE